MREIKYRVWNISFKKWEKYVCPRRDGSPIDIDGHCWQNIESVRDDLVFQFFTGLLDKNNEEIYEGDIITFKEKMHEHGDISSYKGLIVYDPNHAAFGISSIGAPETIWNYFTDSGLSDFEVVGNIFENK